MIKHFSCVENMLDFINNNPHMAVLVVINGVEYWLQCTGENIQLETYEENTRCKIDSDDICTYDMIEGIFDEVKDGYFEIVEI